MTTAIATVKSAFDELLKRIELDPTRAALASQRYNAVKTQLESALSEKQVIQVGSFQRKTKIRPLDPNDPLDVDALVCFGSAYRYACAGEQGTTPAGALETVRRALTQDKTYRLMKPASDAPTVVLEYADGFKMELIPSFRELTGRYPRQNAPACHIVGDAKGNWVPADYEYDAELISGTNQAPAISGALVPSIKMVKAFLRGKGSALKSFHIEVLCTQIIPAAIARWEASSLSWGYQHVLAQFLSQAGEFLRGPAQLPGSYTPPVDSELSKSEMMNEGLTLNVFGGQAWAICKLGDTSGSLEAWSTFFGEPFPG